MLQRIIDLAHLQPLSGDLNPVEEDGEALMADLNFQEGVDYAPQELYQGEEATYANIVITQEDFNMQVSDLWGDLPPMSTLPCNISMYWPFLSNGVNCNGAGVMYFYHPDYLGHTEYITDHNGAAYQYFHYSAFGETLIEEHSGQGTHTDYFRFNGKELDPETGNYYYGARYYDPKVSIWLSVDPMSSERPNLTPYNFMSNNPVMRVDPDGRKDIIYDHEGNQTGVENDNWFHNFFFGENHYITDEGGENRFKLGEQGLAVMQSENFEGFMSDWETSNSADGLNARITDATDDYDPMEENVLDYVLRESGDGGEMDQKLQLNENKLYGFAGKALNVNEAGNVVWGAAMNVFGMDPFGTYFSAHGGTLRLRGRLDERDDSSAAMMGSFYMQRSPAGRQLRKTLTKQIYGEWLKKNYGLTPR